MPTGKNRAIEFYRFLFCCVVFALHLRWLGDFPTDRGTFSGGYLVVEFYFLVAGFLMMRGIARRPGKAVRYLAGRYRRLYPMYLLTALLVIAAFRLTDPSYSLHTALVRGLPELLALQIFWRPFGIDLHLWYVSALLWASFAVYALASKRRALFLGWIEPLALLLFIGYAGWRHGTVDLTDPGVLPLSGVRAFVELGLGCCLYVLWERLERAPRRLPAWLYTGLELALTLVLLGVMFETQRGWLDFVMIFVIAAFVLLIFLGRGRITRALDNRVSAFLGSISYAMYLNQLLVVFLTRPLFERLTYWPAAALSLLVLIGLAWLETRLFSVIKRRLSRA